MKPFLTMWLYGGRFSQLNTERHPETSTIGSQCHNGDCTNDWQNLSLHALTRQAPVTLIHSGKQRVEKGGNNDY